MALQRRGFIKKACLGGLCLCGFGQVLGAQDTVAPENSMHREWIWQLLNGMEKETDPSTVHRLLKEAAKADYKRLNMDRVLAPYAGDPDGFCSFLEQEWGWKISFDREKEIILADENKPSCVCPLLKDAERLFPVLCYCSEGFAELMFSAVFTYPVRASVVSSIQRGDSHCVYKIETGKTTV